MAALLNELRGLVGASQVMTDPRDTMGYATACKRRTTGALLSGRASDVSLNVSGSLGGGSHKDVLSATGTDAGWVDCALLDVVTASGRSVSADHRLGACRLDEWRRLAPESAIVLAQRLKGGIDPQHLMPPDKAMSAPEAGARQ